MHLDTEADQLCSDDIGGARFLEGKFGVGVDVTPPGGEVVVPGFELVALLHPSVPQAICSDRRKLSIIDERNRN